MNIKEALIGIAIILFFVAFVILVCGLMENFNRDPSDKFFTPTIQRCHLLLTEKDNINERLRARSQMSYLEIKGCEDRIKEIDEWIEKATAKPEGDK